jgi:hypothetical protein
MTIANHGLRRRILTAMGSERLTGSQIAQRISGETSSTIFSSLRAMYADRVIKRTKGSAQKVPVWWVA